MLKLKNATYSDPESPTLHEQTYDLGKDGSKWSHGYIPLNPAAVALKHHKQPGGDSGGSTAKGLASRATGGSGRTKADIHKAAVDRAAKAAQARHARLNGFKVVEDEPTAAKSESLDEIAKRNMGSDLTKAKSNDLRTYSQFGHQGSKDELSRRAAKRSTPKSVSENDKAVLRKASADQLVKYRENYGPGTPEHDAINEEIADRLTRTPFVSSNSGMTNSHVGRQSPSADRIGAEAAQHAANARANEAARREDPRVTKAHAQLSAVQDELKQLRAIPANRRSSATERRIRALSVKQTRLNTITRFGVQAFR